MNVAKDKVVAIDYRLRDGEGSVLDESEQGEPFYYLHGAGNLVPGLERALDGRAAGDAIKISVEPDEGYGQRLEELQIVVHRDRFRSAGPLEEGMQFRADTDEGPRLFTVVGIEGDDVSIDGNHPLAGETLHFEVKIVEVRDATADELAHGHPHGPDGHGHHHDHDHD